MNKLPLILQGRTVLVTTGGAGLGLGICEALAGGGANVVLTVRRNEAGEAAAERIRALGGSVLPIVADATSMSQMQEAVQKAVVTFGGLDIVVHNANSGGDSSMPVALESVTEEQWDFQARVAHGGSLHPGETGLSASEAERLRPVCAACLLLRPARRRHESDLCGAQGR